jgi:hypothetical protein
MKSINYIKLLTCITCLLTLTIGCEKDEVGNGDVNNISLSSVQADLYLNNLSKEQRDTGFVNFVKNFHLTKKIEEETRRKTNKKTATKSISVARDRDEYYNACSNATQEELTDYETNASEIRIYTEGYIGSKTESVAWQVIKNYFGFWEVTSNETVTLKQDFNDSNNWNITNVTHDGSYMSSTCRLIIASWEEAGYSMYPSFSDIGGESPKTQTAIVRVFGNAFIYGHNIPANNYVVIPVGR